MEIPREASVTANSVEASNRALQGLDWRIGEILRSIGDGNYRLTLKELSAPLATSPRHLGRVFRNQVGVSFHTYLRAARCKRAATLLLDRSRPLKDIAFSAGFTDPSNFSHDFRRVFGLSPRSFSLDRPHASGVAAPGIGSDYREESGAKPHMTISKSL